MPDAPPILEPKELKENFKIVKDYYRLLLLLSATILIFALSPDDAKIYDKSMRELKSFMKYSEKKEVKGYLSYLDEVAVGRANSLHLLDALKDVVGKEGIEGGSPYLNEDPIVSDKKGIKLLGDVEGIDENNLDDLTEGTISEIGQKLSNHPKFYVFEPDVKDLKEALIKKGFADTIRAGYVLTDFRFDHKENGIEDKTSMVGLLINGIAPYSATFKSTKGKPDIYLRGSVRGNMALQIVKTIGDWIEERDTLNNTVPFVHNGTIFPEMRQIWGEVMDKSPKQAYFSLQGKWEEKRAKEKITVLELSFPEKLVLLGCSLVSFCFLLYFNAHLKNLIRLLAPYRATTEISYPWIGFYKGSINLTLLLFSVWILPSVSIIALFIRLGPPSNLNYYISAVLGLGVLILSSQIYVNCTKIRKYFVV